MTAPIEYAHESEISEPIILEASIGNRSRQPAYHTLIHLGIDTDIQILTHGVFIPVRERTDADGIPKNWIIHAKTAPPNMPVFKEVEFILTDSPLALGYHSRFLSGKRRFRVTTIVQTPGFAATEHTREVKALAEQSDSFIRNGGGGSCRPPARDDYLNDHEAIGSVRCVVGEVAFRR
jgi:hypothetical protein